MSLILYLEDHEDDAFFMAQSVKLTGADLTLKHVSTIEEARAYCEELISSPAKGMPDLLVSDLNIRAGDPVGFFRWLRQQPQFAQLPIIVISGTADPGLINRAFAAGANEFIEKSADYRGMLQKIQSFLQPK